MYRSYRGMGSIDWGNILNTGISAGTNILSSVFGQPIGPTANQIPTLPGQTATQQADSFDTGDILGMAAIGAGVFLLIKAMTGKKRRR